ncbi:hypothetical protein [Arthrobacter sp. ISL-28]|nr:hypothetical protein [Arthrobacter sp. ISL-28]MBT2520793.1 hypothetical protein [Arthrobacter sp. ISL-28]
MADHKASLTASANHKKRRTVHTLTDTSHETGLRPWADVYINGHGEH